MLVWNAMPSIVPMMSAILRDDLGDVLHAVDDLAHHLAAARSGLRRSGGQLIGLTGRVSRLVDGCR